MLPRIRAYPDGGRRATGPHLLDIVEEYAKAVVRFRARAGQLDILLRIQHHRRHFPPQPLQEQIADPFENRFPIHGASPHFAA